MLEKYIEYYKSFANLLVLNTLLFGEKLFYMEQTLCCYFCVCMMVTLVLSLDFCDVFYFYGDLSEKLVSEFNYLLENASHLYVSGRLWIAIKICSNHKLLGYQKTKLGGELKLKVRQWSQVPVTTFNHSLVCQEEFPWYNVFSSVPNYRRL